MKDLFLWCVWSACYCNSFKRALCGRAVAQAGFSVVDILERELYDKSIKHQSRRAYFLVKKPS